MQPHQTLVNSSFFKKNILKIRCFILIAFFFLFSLNSSAQNKSAAIGSIADDKIIDMVSHHGKNYIYGQFFVSPDSTLMINNNPIIIDSCFVMGLLVLDDSFNLLHRYCFFDSAGNYTQTFRSGKLAFDSITNSIYLAAEFLQSIVIGDDTIVEATSGFGMYLARFDNQLNPIWAKNPNNCNSLNSNIEIKSIVTDNQGKPWVSIEPINHDKLVCINNDSIYKYGKFYSDSLGILTVSKTPFNMPYLNGSSHTMNTLDSNRMIEVFPTYIQMLDTRMDTVIWSKSKPFKYIYISTVNLETQNLYLLSPQGNIFKYNFQGNLINQSLLSGVGTPILLACNEVSDKLYAYSSNYHFFKIYVLDSTGKTLDTLRWGKNTSTYTSDFMYTKAFYVDKGYLKIAYEANNNIVFGADTIGGIGRFDAFLSFIDLNNSLTSINANRKEFLKPFNVYPIPSNNFINIEGEQKIDVVEMYTLEGKSISITSAENFNTIYFPNNMNKGIYFLKIYSESQEFVVKIIK